MGDMRILIAATVISILVTPTFAQQSRPQRPQTTLERPPEILNLGSDTADGSLTVSCEGVPPFAKVSCRVYRLDIVTPTPESFQKSRNELEKDLREKPADQLLKENRERCQKDLPSEAQAQSRIQNY